MEFVCVMVKAPEVELPLAENGSVNPPPPALSVAQAQVLPFHLRISLVAQVVSRLSATSPLMPPPDSPLPAETLVMSPDAVTSVVQTHAAPFHCKTWLVEHVFSRPRLTTPLVPPPLRPLPAVTPVMVAAVVWVVASPKTMPPLALTAPFTSSFCAGVLVPMPTLWLLGAM